MPDVRVLKKRRIRLNQYRRKVWREVTDTEPAVGQRREVAVEGRAPQQGAFCFAERRRVSGPKAFWVTGDGKNLSRDEVTHYQTWVEIDRPEELFEEEDTALPF